ncbi:hypothetical protein K402DRAFT_405958 [Aulographum hederae CBS 113979]|uniref:Uncharacterized protein n=1 Tax=Aulographum hederae CBS 113979 TaxID=1176131 RepID=A0A6G1GV30_9PEZI|nr:hypothetical protein K402DRAFT_405958 [Aulographum hederae CBS 113979]
MSAIPLHCNICPKKPDFSDVSHLLTHIASKGHLSHYYKIKVRSSTEEDSRRLVDAYDQWYADWNVEDLMSERMSLKEKRRARPKQTVPASRKPTVPSNVPLRRSPRKPAPRQRFGNLDPRLVEGGVKSEHSTPEYGIQSAIPLSSLSRSSLYMPAMPAMPALNPHSLYRRGPRLHRTILQDYDAYSDDESDSSESKPFSESTTSECTKLKGIYWPGMDIFDSATPEMKRKRNQKKDISVVEQLELNSREVEATELIFNPYDLTFKKQRKISSLMDEESSPMRGESPRRAFLDRPALLEIEGNRSRRYQESPVPRMPDFSQAIYQDAQVEHQLTYGNKRKRGFEIFHDEEPEVTFGHPTGFNYLTSEFPYPQHNDGHYDASKTFSHHYQAFGKENNQPVYTQSWPTTNSYAQHHHQQQPSMFAPVQHNHGLHTQVMPGFFNNNQPMNYTGYKLEDELDEERTITAPPSDT